ncbi:MAG: family 78 glycoside hydrolase catalytic domain [Sphingobacteriales bacterium]|nr:family 78 glycoside hydrolase catalytic domain [Sphingobacteriales bacterium]OJY91376.1 MAG: alpha-L-rhamnosidase [Sphingobacteriales bacterium 44-15]
MRSRKFYWQKSIITLLFGQFVAIYTICAAPMLPEKLTCEYTENPLGIDIARPRLSWIFSADQRNQRQTAYEILVSDNIAELNKGNGTIWTTGRVISAENTNVVYDGVALKPFTRYFWKVRAYNNSGEVSPWSGAAWFETAMLSAGDWSAKWIGDGSRQFERDEDFFKDDPNPLFRKDFRAGKQVASARLYICGLGYYEAYINGKRAGDHILDPGWTNYGKECLYATYDITSLLKKGDNAMGIMLGNGWYNAAPIRLFGRFVLRNVQQTGRPCVIAQLRLTYTDGKTEVIGTDQSWNTLPGPVLRNNIYLGEHYDARLEKDGWNTKFGQSSSLVKQAEEVKGPDGILSAQVQPPVRITKVIKPISIAQTSPGTFLVDMGQNFAGVARIRVRGKAGTKIVMRYGEDKYADGTIDVMTTVAGQIKNGNGGPGVPKVAWQEDSYILKGEGIETWAPRFTFHGFRYVEIKGWPGIPQTGDIEGLRMNSDVLPTGEFSCSDTIFNKLDQNIQWTFLSNIFSVQSDCPGREKLGYGGDMVATANAFIYHFDMANFYRKTIRDFVNDQRPPGGITETAPYVGIADRGPGDGSGPLGWQLAYPFLIQQLYEFYGDKRIIEDNYPALARQAAFLKQTAVEGLHWIDISDHEALDTKPESFSAALFYYHHIMLMAEFADILGKGNEAKEYASSAAQIRNAIISRYLVNNTGRFDNATQSAQILALWYKIVPEKEKERAVKVLMDEFARHDWHLSTGIFSTKMMFDVLRDLDSNDVAWRVAAQKTFPGWKYMIDKGATTLWETWAYSDNVYSQNHPMFGSVGEWFYRSLLGINPAAPGFEKIIIKPQPAGDLTYAAGSYRSVKGNIVSNWKLSGGIFLLEVAVPGNTIAEIWVSAAENDTITEDGQPVEAVKDIRLLRREKHYAVFETGSGKYSFEVRRRP